MNSLNIDPGQIGTDILNAVRGVIDEDLPTLKQFVKAQLEGLAEQAVLVAKGLALGWIDTEEEKKHWARTLREMATEFAKTLRALVVITVEKAVNAILGVLEGVFKTVAGAAIPF